MKSILSTLILSVALAGCVQGFESQDNFSTPRAATVMLTVDGRAFCSAVAISETLAVTAAHCVDDATLWNNPVPPKLDGFSFQVEKIDEKHDLALLKVHEPYKFPFPIKINKDILQRDQELVAVGFPLNEGLHNQILTEGRFQGSNLNGFLVITTPLAPGNSGGGIFYFKNGDWYLAGIASAIARVPLDMWSGDTSLITHTALAASYSYIWKLLEGISVES